MIAKGFWADMKERGKHNIRWIVLYMAFLLIVLVREESFGDQAIRAFFLTALIWEYYRKYLRLVTGSAEMILYEGETVWLGELMRPHCFPVKDYFSLLERRFFAPEAFLAMWVMSVSLLTGRMALLWWIVPIFALPFLANRLFKRMCVNQMTREQGAGAVFFGALFGALFSLAEVIAVTIVVVLGSILLYGIVIELFTLRVPDTAPAYLSYGDTGFFPVMVIMAALAGYLLQDNSAFGKRFRLRGWFLALALLFAALSGSWQARHYTLMEDGSIVVRQGKAQMTYETGDVRSYRIYAQSDSLRMELTFRDGAAAQVFSDISSPTEAWYEVYDNEYRYAAALAELFASHGADGSIEGLESLDVSGLNEQVQEGFRRLLEMEPELESAR